LNEELIAINFKSHRFLKVSCDVINVGSVRTTIAGLMTSSLYILHLKFGTEWNVEFLLNCIRDNAKSNGDNRTLLIYNRGTQPFCYCCITFIFM